MVFVAAGCFVMAILAFLNGFVTEYRQSRQAGPVAIVATLPFAVAAALFVLLGLAAMLGHGVPWWCLPLGFVGSLLGFGFSIMRAGAPAVQRQAEPGAAVDRGPKAGRGH